MGMARSAGQVLFDLAISDIDSVVGTRERFGALIYSYFIEKDQPTKNFFRVWDSIYKHSMVKHNPISFVATMGRVATVEMLGGGTLHENQKD